MSAYKATHTCQHCGAEFEAASHNAVYCKQECRLAFDRNRRRITPMAEKACETCGSMFRPRRDMDVTCGPECASRRYNESRNYSAGDSSQMEKLFRYYKARESIVIAEAPEGTRLLALSDMQIPFVDQPLLDTIETLIDDWKPNVILYVGDGEQLGPVHWPASFEGIEVVAVHAEIIGAQGVDRQQQDVRRRGWCRLPIRTGRRGEGEGEDHGGCGGIARSVVRESRHEPAT